MLYNNIQIGKFKDKTLYQNYEQDNKLRKVQFSEILTVPWNVFQYTPHWACLAGRQGGVGGGKMKEMRDQTSLYLFGYNGTGSLITIKTSKK